MKKLFFLSLFYFTSVFASGGGVNSDNTFYLPGTSPSEQKGKWYYGGNFGANFWNDYILVSVEPMAGYKVSSKFSLGLKTHYSFIMEDNDVQDLTYHNFGGSVFARYSPVPLGYLHAEFVYRNYEQYSFNSVSNKFESDRVWVPFLLLGAGYKQPLGPNASLYAEVLVDVIQDKNSPFKKWEPIFHVGAAVGF
ncbi:MAG: hypothetical protein KGZ85_16740 [Ignavibacterium sp.]|nr:hypothetical protein [Ignavibacterium sp.]